ncbi:hypothetical protein [Longivirga aurantiaca]
MDGTWRPLEGVVLHRSADGVRVQVIWGLEDTTFRSTLLSAALDRVELTALTPLIMTGPGQ